MGLATGVHVRDGRDDSQQIGNRRTAKRREALLNRHARLRVEPGQHGLELGPRFSLRTGRHATRRALHGGMQLVVGQRDRAPDVTGGDVAGHLMDVLGESLAARPDSYFVGAQIVARDLIGDADRQQTARRGDRNDVEVRLVVSGQATRTAAISPAETEATKISSPPSGVQTG